MGQYGLDGNITNPLAALDFYENGQHLTEEDRAEMFEAGYITDDGSITHAGRDAIEALRTRQPSIFVRNPLPPSSGFFRAHPRLRVTS